jgi:hypothetical protein
VLRCSRLCFGCLCFRLGLFNGFFGLLNDESVDLGQNCFEEYDNFIYDTSYLTCAVRSCPEHVSPCKMEVYDLRMASAVSQTSGAFAGAQVRLDDLLLCFVGNSVLETKAASSWPSFCKESCNAWSCCLFEKTCCRRLKKWCMKATEPVPSQSAKNSSLGHVEV